MPLKNETLAPFVRKIEQQTSLDSDDRAALLALPQRTALIDAGTYIVRQGDRTDQCCVILTGFTCRSRMTTDGSRQIMAIHMRGDAVDLQNSMLNIADHNVQTLTHSHVAYIPHDAIVDVIAKRPRLGEALWRQTLIEASIAHEWMLNIGRRSGRQRISHFICELATLQNAAGLSMGPNYHWPISQEQLGDAMGLTPVHVNRMLQSLRSDGLVQIAKHRLTIPDWEAIRRAGDFGSAYLHQNAATSERRGSTL